MSTHQHSYRIIKLGHWAAVLEGDADGDGSNRQILEIKGGTELKTLSDPAREAMLATVASFGGTLLGALGETYSQRLDEQLLSSAGAAGADTATSILHVTGKLSGTRRTRVQRAATLQHASSQIITLMLDAVTTYESTPAQIEERATIAADIYRLLFNADSAQIDALLRALEPAQADPSAERPDMLQAEARARLRMKAIYQKVLAESLTVAQLRDQYKLSRQRLKQLRDEDRLFAIDIPYQRGLVYPAWQLDSAGRPLPVMQTLIRAARGAGLDALGFHLLITGPREGARSGLRLLHDGREDLVLALIRAADR
jgi:hypothetical protein